MSARTDTELYQHGSLSAVGRHSRPYVLAVCLILATSFFWRLRDLDRTPIAGDEGVACINAMAVLEHGLPVNMYLGQPIFDNNFIRTWAGNPEYEFKDIGYGPTGLKVYHNWLPIYAFAGALRAFGIRPGDAKATRPVYSEAERRRMTFAVRLISLIFGMLSIVGLWLAGSAFDGPVAGLVAALLGAFLPLYASLSAQAHYYSAAMALSALCAWSVMRMLTRGRRKDFVISSLLLSVLFHISMLSAVVMCGMWAMAVLLIRIRTGFWPVGQAMVFAGIMAVLCFPWIALTGLLAQNQGIPKALALLRFPHDLISKLEFYPFYALTVLGMVLVTLPRLHMASSMLDRLHEEIGNGWEAYILLYTWFAAVLFAFLLMIPAAGFGLTRVALSLLVPGILLAAKILASLTRVVTPGNATPFAIAATLVLLLAANYVQRRIPATEARAKTWDIESVVSYLNTASLPQGTRLYADPNDHLILTFYTGLPIQNIGAVRKEFLDSYPEAIVYLEKEELSPTTPIQPVNLKTVAAAAGTPITNEQAVRLSCTAASLQYRSGLATRVKEVRPTSVSIPPSLTTSIAQHEQLDQRRQAKISADARSKSLLFRDAEPVKTNFDWWTGYFFAFVDAADRKAHPNFEARLRNSTATILPCSSWTAFYSPGISAAAVPRAAESFDLADMKGCPCSDGLVNLP